MLDNEQKTAIQEADKITDEERRKANRAKSTSNLKPFRKFSELTDEERKRQQEISNKGAQGAKETFAKRRSMNDAARALLNAKISREKAVQILGDDLSLFGDTDKLTVADILNGSLVQAVTIDRNVKAYEALRDTAGYAPKKEVEISADIMTDNDRLLLENIKNRLAIVQNDEKPIGKISG